MRARSSFILIVALACGVAGASFAQQNTTTVSFDSGSYTLYSSMVQNNSTVLSAGGLSTSGDGDMLRLGYYTDATPTDLFAGNFVALSGAGSANTAYNSTSIGDDANNFAGPGTFALSLSFVAGSSTTGQNLPTSASQILAIQYYNNTTLETSTMFNAVSSSSWLFKLPAAMGQLVSISLDDPGVAFLGTSDFTSVAVPEPQSMTWITLGAAFCGSAVWAKRRRRSMVSLA